MNRAFIAAALSYAAAVGVLPLVAATPPAQGAPLWRLAPAQAPPPPLGVPPAPYAVPLGSVGEISFWAPNRGLAITGGSGPVPAGLYAYDGVAWHQLSTVCGGARGRIAWAGPDEFWTISDQRAGQQLPPGTGNPSLQSLSLCHFLNGQVVGSYAMPLGQPDSYLPMDAAACDGPDDCWFGGMRGEGPTAGAFHLHWDGTNVTQVFEPEDHAITDMVAFAGALYESVQIGQHDAFLPQEEPNHPAVIHTIATGGRPVPCGEIESVFCDVFTFDEEPPEPHQLPVYGNEVLPTALQGLSLATDGSPLGGGEELWAAANPVPAGLMPMGSRPASLTVLRDDAGTWSQVLPNREGKLPSGLGEGATLAGGESRQELATDEPGTSSAVAPEPGGSRAWLSLGGGAGARVVLLNADGTLAEPPVVLPGEWEPEPVGERGNAGPIACPAAHDCWMATSSGWLFHLSEDQAEAPDEDPFFDGGDGVITYRPADAGVPVVYPSQYLGEEPVSTPPPPLSPPLSRESSARRRQHAKPLVEHLRSRFTHGHVLDLSFTLTARAHVQLVGQRGQRVVASTRRLTLSSGPHTLSLSLTLVRWPTKIRLHATPLGGLPPQSSNAHEAPSNSASAPANSNDQLET